MNPLNVHRIGMLDAFDLLDSVTGKHKYLVLVADYSSAIRRDHPALQFGIPWEGRRIYRIVNARSGNFIKDVTRKIRELEPLCFPDTPFDEKIKEQTRIIEAQLRKFGIEKR